VGAGCVVVVAGVTVRVTVAAGEDTAGAETAGLRGCVFAGAGSGLGELEPDGAASGPAGCWP
jgi:hypothetical protein